MNNFEQIKKIIVDQLGVDADAVTPETTIEDLGVDSLDLVETIMTVEDEFGITFDDGDVEGLKTVGDIADYIESKK